MVSLGLSVFCHWGLSTGVIIEPDPRIKDSLTRESRNVIENNY